MSEYTVGRIEQLSLAHKSARPKHSNPAWINTHRDLGIAREEIKRLSTEYSAVCEAAKRVIGSSTPLDDPDPNWCMANIDDLETLERVSGRRDD